jgi:hypothetical protein
MARADRCRWIYETANRALTRRNALSGTDRMRVDFDWIGSLKAVAQVRVISGLLVVTLSWPAELSHFGPARAGSRSGSQQVKSNADRHEQRRTDHPSRPDVPLIVRSARGAPGGQVRRSHGGRACRGHARRNRSIWWCGHPGGTQVTGSRHPLLQAAPVESGAA